jgi:hypothetical protein
MKRFLLLGVAVAGLVQGTTVSLNPIADGRGTIGDPGDFMVVNGSVTTNNTGFADILLNFNYRTSGAGGPSSPLGPFPDFGSTLNVGDLLFQVGSHDYGIPLFDHSGAPNGGNAALFANVLHAHFYQSTTDLNALTVLNNPPNVDYRKTTNVWLGGSVIDLGLLTETITFSGGSTPKYTVELTGQLPAAFLSDIIASAGGQRSRTARYADAGTAFVSADGFGAAWFGFDSPPARNTVDI